jgi:hypothetical protein
VVCLTVGYMTAHQIFTRVGNLPGQRVLIHGARGGTGSAMLDVAWLLGLEACGTASVGKHDLSGNWGASRSTTASPTSNSPPTNPDASLATHNSTLPAETAQNAKSGLLLCQAAMSCVVWRVWASSRRVR